MILQLIANYACRVGESPLWHPLDHHVYWLDIPTGAIFRYDPMTDAHEIFYQAEALTGGLTIQEDGSLLLFGKGGSISRLHEGTLTPLVTSLPGEENNRFNDVIADPSGCVLCGTTPYTSDNRSGSLYRLERDGSTHKLLDNILVSNGMGFSPDLNTFYYSDSKAQTVTQFRYDQDTGDLFDPQPFAMISAQDGVPDGLTVDAEGFIWLAVWDGSRLIRYDAKGSIEREIMFPVKQVSSLTFGGDEYSDMYITTAGGHDTLRNGALAGSLFRLQLGIKGTPEFRSRILVEE